MEQPSPRLSLTIFLELFHRIPQPSDILLLMRTSKALLKLGENELVGRGVTVKSDAQVRSFCDFVLRGSASRAIRLRRLSLEFRYDSEDEQCSDDDGEFDGAYPSGPPPPSKATCGLLLEVLRRATNLEDLRIDSCEELLQRQTAIQDVVAALKAGY